MRFVTLSALALLALAACRKEEELLVDLDQDGSLSDQDCDDTDATVFPGAEEICDGADNDCDGEVDEDANDAPSWYADADGDGHGDAAAAVTACAAPEGSVATDDDCDDTDAAFHPGAPETDCADPADYNCDGSVGFADADGDGFAACEECDDNESAVFPGGEEVCDGLDNDCDGLVDDEASDALAWYADVDGDGYGNAAVSERACEAPAGFVSAAEDCDDLAAAAHPGGTEVCDGLDNDCDGTADVAATDASAWYADADGDHYGDPEAEVRACAAPQGHVATAGDCDDAHAAAHPGGVEVCDSLDNDCDGEVDEDAADAPRWYQDLDDDGFGDAEVALESCAAPPGYVAGDQDCDDGDGDVFPGAEELCATAWDDDCDGQVNEADAGDVSSWHLDADGDGHGRPGGEVLACVAPDAHVASADDCDDLDADVAPGLPEVPGDGLDNDCVAGDDTPVVFVADRYDGDLWAVDRYSGVASLLTNSGEPATDLVAGADGLVYLARPDAIGLLAVDPSDGSHLEALTDEEFQWRGVTGLFEDRVADRLLLALSSGRVLSLDPATGDAELVAEALPALADVARLPGSDALWLVLRYAPGLYRLDPVDGVLEEVLSLPERTPRLALSSDGHLWLSGEGALYRVDTLHRRYEEQTVSVGLHGLCADATGEDLLLGTGGAGLQRYAVSTGITQPVAPRVGEAGACAVQVGTDYDGDGHQALRFGGDDCDDLDPGVYYGAADDSADGVDQNCDLVDGTDADRDGGASLATGGTDCDDADPAVFLGVAGCEAGARSCA
ncbi:MAG: putative metal-binding motif-containing protein, partial [Deltaproteobacteria bacterium]|nr:putative metal-binding motif-containing protein [Deltaproteobacteria bacterium]